MRLLGGIGGADREPTLATYHTCTNNPNGIVAGSQDSSACAGDLRRGWLGQRPFPDVLMPVDAPDGGRQWRCRCEPCHVTTFRILVRPSGPALNAARIEWVISVGLSTPAHSLQDE